MRHCPFLAALTPGVASCAGATSQHYYAIAEKSTLTTGAKLPVNEEKFKGCFGEEWSAVVAEGRAFNALEFKNKFAAFQEEGALDKAWDATSVDNKTRVKLGGGFYCGQIEVDGVKYYTFNAFFMTMRGKPSHPTNDIPLMTMSGKLEGASRVDAPLAPTQPFPRTQPR